MWWLIILLLDEPSLMRRPAWHENKPEDGQLTNNLQEIGVGARGKKGTYERLYVLLNLYERSYNTNLTVLEISSIKGNRPEACGLLVSSPCLDGRALCQQLGNVLWQWHHPPWLRVSSAITLGLLCTPPFWQESSPTRLTGLCHVVFLCCIRPTPWL